MITKYDVEIIDHIPDEFMPHLSELKIYMRGNTDDIHNCHQAIMAALHSSKLRFEQANPKESR